MREQADLWARRWLAAVFLVLIATALFPRAHTDDAAQGKVSPVYVGNIFEGRFTVSKKQRVSTIRPGGHGIVRVRFIRSGDDADQGDGHTWMVVPAPYGAQAGSIFSPAGWTVNGISEFKEAEDCFEASVCVPASAAEGEYVLFVTLYATLPKTPACSTW